MKYKSRMFFSCQMLLGERGDEDFSHEEFSQTGVPHENGSRVDISVN